MPIKKNKRENLKKMMYENVFLILGAVAYERADISMCSITILQQRLLLIHSMGIALLLVIFFL